MRELLTALFFLILLVGCDQKSKGIQDAKTALELVCDAVAKDFRPEQQEVERRRCELENEAIDNKNYWTILPKQKSFGYVEYAIGKTDGDITVSIVN